MTKPSVSPVPEQSYDTSLYDFAFPVELIAQSPLADRDQSRLLIIDRARDEIRDGRVSDLPDLLAPGDLLVFNDTRVVKARIEAERTDTRGRVEVLVVEAGEGSATVLVRARGRLAPGVTIEARGSGGERLELRLREPLGEGSWSVDTGVPALVLHDWLDRNGRVPLPPYVRRDRGADPNDALDAERYQTILASRPGAVAAPTAGLHFSEALLKAVEARGIGRACVTLHVGPGTFRPVTSPDLRAHAMHSEMFEVSAECAAAVRLARERGRRVVAIGTTAVRALESSARNGEVASAAGRTSLFIHPPYVLRTIDALVTNFHAPRSTLLMLVAAFAGRELILRAYDHAVASRYRLLSYGDATVIL
jgi:S-adenosylmethionine:tRNA ribosyltransferase-isomerase